MAQRLDEAFAGCEQWTIAPPSQRRSDARSSARGSRAPSRISGSAAAVRTQEPRAL